MRQSQKRLLIYYSFFFCASQAILLLFLFYQKNKNENEYLAFLIDQKKAEYNSVLWSQRLLARTIFEEIINRPVIVRAVHQSYSLDETDRAINRKKLLRQLLPAYERLKQDRIRQVHFHFPDGTSFLRLHKPQKFGDNLLNVRASVRLAGSKKSYVEGFEAGRSYHAFRHVFPLFYENDYAGSVEISVPFYQFRKNLIEAFPAEQLFIIKRKIVEQKLLKENRDNYQLSIIHKDFFIETADILTEPAASDPHHIDPAIIEGINRQLHGDIVGAITRGGPFASIRKFKKELYVTTFLPVRNVENVIAGYIIYYQKDPWLPRLLRSYYITYGLVTILTFLLMGLYLVSTRKLTRKNDFLGVVIESLPHPFYVIDIKDHVVKLANSKVAENGAWQGKTCFDLTHHVQTPCDQEDHVCPLEQVLKTGREVVVEHIHYNAAGQARQVEVHGCPVFDDNGSIVQMIEYSLDITDRKLAEAEREKLIAELQNALEEIRQLSGILPICASCKSIRDDKGYWNKVEQYIAKHAEVEFTHGICPDCAQKLYPDLDLYEDGAE